jgi:hypothetical protein
VESRDERNTQERKMRRRTKIDRGKTLNRTVDTVDARGLNEDATFDSMAGPGRM